MKFSDKLSKVGDSFTVNLYNNGYMIEVSGKDREDGWSTIKLICSTSDELVDHIKEITSMERDQ